MDDSKRKLRGGGAAAAGGGAAAAAAASVDAAFGGGVGSLSGDGGLAVVRIKPLGAGGGGGERSAVSGIPAVRAVRGTDGRMGVSVGGSAGGKSMMWQNEKIWSYPEHVISPEDDQARLYEKFVPQRVEAFLEGFPVNICCYGQTGSGKTHTMFGPPGLMERAAQGNLCAIRSFSTCDSRNCSCAAHKNEHG